MGWTKSCSDYTTTVVIKWRDGTSASRSAEDVVAHLVAPQTYGGFVSRVNHIDDPKALVPKNRNLSWNTLK